MGRRIKKLNTSIKIEMITLMTICIKTFPPYSSLNQFTLITQKSPVKLKAFMTIKRCFTGRVIGKLFLVL
jgi:hypothetical protein